MSTADVTAEEVTESVTGFDEIAVEKHFHGLDLYMDGEAKPVKLLRALIFVHLRHTAGEHGKDAATAEAAMSMTLRDVQDYFKPDTEANPADPDTESGKGDSQVESEPDGSPPSAWPPESTPASTTD